MIHIETFTNAAQVKFVYLFTHMLRYIKKYSTKCIYTLISHIYTHLSLHTYIPICLHTYMLTYIHTYNMHTCICTSRHTTSIYILHVCTYMHIYSHEYYIHAYNYPCTSKNTHSSLHSLYGNPIGSHG